MNNTHFRQNLHTHTQYCDGKSTMEEMILFAIEHGYSSLGFSSHSWQPLDTGSMTPDSQKKYINDFFALKEKYGDQIDLHLGLELDSLSDENLRKSGPFEYMIGSVHYLNAKGKEMAIDESREIFESLLSEGFDDDIYAMLAAYYATVKKMIEASDRRGFEIVGHIDLISKYNEEETFFRFDDPEVLDLAMDAVKAGIDRGLIFEINTGAISRGYRTLPYPHPALLKRMADAGAKFCISTDCHNAKDIAQSYEEAIRLAQSAGIDTFYVLAEDGFVPVKASTLL